MKIVFFGTADFGLETLKAILDSPHEIAAVVTNPPRPAGRGMRLRPTPVEIFALEREISPIFTPDDLKDEEFLSRLKKIEADLFLVVAFSILPEAVFKIPRLGTYNIHAALLPEFRGPAPIQRAIESGAKRTGVTVFRIDGGVDTGDVVLQKECEILPEDDAVALYEKLSVLGAQAFTEALGKIESGTVEYKIQDKSKATKAPLLKKEEAIINWQESAQILANRVRAFKRYPTSVTTLNGEQITVEKAFVADLAAHGGNGRFGEICAIGKNEIYVHTGDGILAITQLKPSGKRTMDVRDFLNGKQIKEGIILG